MPLLTRREITLLLFALSIFLIAYNFDSSVSPFSLARSSLSDLSASALLNVQNAFREDGRRTAKLTDELEVEVLGDWEIETRKSFDLGPYNVTEDQQHVFWSDGNILATQLVAHVPGYTILDNVLLANGTLYLVSDHAVQVFPRPEGMLSTDLGTSDPPVLQDLRFVTRRQALDVLGYSAHRISGASVVCFDHPNLVDKYTFLALHRAYATLADPSSTPLVPPSQTIFANTKRLAIDETGYSLKLARIAYPFMGHLFAEEWDDLERSTRPMIFDRVLLADRTAAEHGAQSFDFTADVVSPHNKEKDAKERVATKAGKKDKAKAVLRGVTIEATDKRLSFAPAFALPARPDWAKPIREGALTIPTPAGSEKRRAIMYFSNQGSRTGPKLRDVDHESLVRELERLGTVQKWDVHIVELAGEDASSWADHVRAAAQSSVMLSVYGDSLTSSVLLRPGPPTPAIIEFFPDGKFTNENELVARALGVQYVAWRNTKKYPRGSLPPISPPAVSDSRILSVDVPAVAAFVKEQMRLRR
ncbi:hypothetical protein ACEPAF_1322 [Sanghuangporus sanghuang]